MRVRGSTSVNTEVTGTSKTTALLLFLGCVCVVQRTPKPKTWGHVLAELWVMGIMDWRSLGVIRQVNRGLSLEGSFTWRLLVVEKQCQYHLLFSWFILMDAVPCVTYPTTSMIWLPLLYSSSIHLSLCWLFGHTKSKRNQPAIEWIGSWQDKRVWSNPCAQQFWSKRWAGSALW